MICRIPSTIAVTINGTRPIIPAIITPIVAIIDAPDATNDTPNAVKATEAISKPAPKAATPIPINVIAAASPIKGTTIPAAAPPATISTPRANASPATPCRTFSNGIADNALTTGTSRFKATAATVIAAAPPKVPLAALSATTSMPTVSANDIIPELRSSGFIVVNSLMTFCNITIAAAINSILAPEKFLPPNLDRRSIAPIRPITAMVPLAKALSSNSLRRLTTSCNTNIEAAIAIMPLALKLLPPSLVIAVISIIRTPTANMPFSILSGSSSESRLTEICKMRIATDIPIRPLVFKLLPPSLVIRVANAMSTPTARTPLTNLSGSIPDNALVAKANIPMAIANAAIAVPNCLNRFASASLVSFEIAVTAPPSSTNKAVIPKSATAILPGSIVDNTNIEPTRIAMAFAIFMIMSALIDSCIALNGPVILSANLPRASPTLSAVPPRSFKKLNSPLNPSTGSAMLLNSFLRPKATPAAEPAVNMLSRLSKLAFLREPNMSLRTLPAESRRYRTPPPSTLPIVVRTPPIFSSTLVAF